MKILYCLPSLESVYAARFVYEGFKNAFIDLGHAFRVYTAENNFTKTLSDFQPDIFIYSLNFYHRKFINFDVLDRYRQKGLVVLCQVRGWHPSSNDLGAQALKDNRLEIELIRSGRAGDIFWHWFEQDEPLMKGFTEATGKTFETIIQAADSTLYYPQYDSAFESDLAYVGSFLSSKRDFFRAHVFPLKKQYDLRIYGSDWTAWNRMLGKVQKAGQYFNIPLLKKIRIFPLRLDDERRVYSSAKLSLNVHEEQVKRFNCEINERTFKIMACGGFELVDNLPLLRRYFNDRELAIAENTRVWFEKIEYFLHHPAERKKIAERGMKKVLAEHTYHHRVKQIIALYHQYKQHGSTRT